MPEKREQLAVAGFVVLCALPFLGKAFHLDEVEFLLVARQILKDPWHPLSFTLSWYLCPKPASSAFIHSTLVPYILAAAERLTGGSEITMRLACLPFDIVAALALHRLARRFLDKPLWPVLVILACPGWLLCVSPLMAEKWTMALSLSALCLVAERRIGLGAVLLGLAVIAKHTAAVFLAPAAALLYLNGVKPRRMALWLAAALAPALIDALLLEPGRLAAVAAVDLPLRMAEAGGVHRLRSLLAFTGGCGAATLLWPCARAGAPRRRHLLTLAGAAWVSCLLFSSLLDPAGASIRPVDRLTGALMAFACLSAFARLCEPEARGQRGDLVWSAWALAAAAAAWLNWAVSARSVLPLLPPLALAGAARLEKAWKAAERERFYMASLAACFALSLCLGWIDFSFAEASRAAGSSTAAIQLEPGRKLWYTGHWGLQNYMPQEAFFIDPCAGGWDAVGQGDTVLIPTVNAGLPLPPMRAPSLDWTIKSALPLRLMSFEGANQAGFFSNSWGFLPYALSRAPLERFTLISWRKTPPPTPRPGRR
ncbi:MAG: hypothetical protein HY077_08330 [Elusimicrobia bacterium]|nr:hypothetical protein [Elusimicrobiota bacterium]